jgi:hypothetical protein
VAGQRGIPRNVRSLITDHLSSVAQLEILLLLHGASEQQFSAGEVAERLRIDPAWAADELNGLSSAGLLGHDSASGTFTYAPRTAEKGDAVDGLAKAFSTHRVSVITLLFSTPSEGIGSFADAFKLRKDDDHG